MPQHSAEYYTQGQTLLLDKPKDWTSFNVVNKVRGHLKWSYQIKKLKVGHAGTLDPLATGLLIICTGKHTKQISQYSGLDKVYVAEIDFGYTTPSYDLETEIDEKFPYEHITESLIKEKLEDFKGEQEQIPPIYSAKSIDGKRAYKYAREGKPVEMRKSTVTFHELELISFAENKATIRVKCSAGTYIRSFAYDLGKALGSGATLSNLRRISIGQFSADDAMSIDIFEKNA